MTRRYYHVWLLSVMLVIFGGCSDDGDPIVPEPTKPQVLGVIGLNFDVSSPTLSSSLEVSFMVGISTPSPALLFSFQGANELSGAVITVDAATNPAFEQATSMLINGEDNLVDYDFKLSGGAGNGISAPESFLFQGGVTGDYLPDFAGARITHVVIAIDVISLEIPGGDLNGDGIWTDSSGTGRLVIMGHP